MDSGLSTRLERLTIKEQCWTVRPGPYPHGWESCIRPFGYPGCCHFDCGAASKIAHVLIEHCESSCCQTEPFLLFEFFLCPFLLKSYRWSVQAAMWWCAGGFVVGGPHDFCVIPRVRVWSQGLTVQLVWLMYVYCISQNTSFFCLYGQIMIVQIVVGN